MRMRRYRCMHLDCSELEQSIAWRLREQAYMVWGGRLRLGGYWIKKGRRRGGRDSWVGGAGRADIAERRSRGRDPIAVKLAANRAR